MRIFSSGFWEEEKWCCQFDWWASLSHVPHLCRIAQLVADEIKLLWWYGSWGQFRRCDLWRVQLFGWGGRDLSRGVFDVWEGCILRVTQRWLVPAPSPCDFKHTPWTFVFKMRFCWRQDHQNILTAPFSGSSGLSVRQFSLKKKQLCWSQLLFPLESSGGEGVTIFNGDRWVQLHSGLMQLLTQASLCLSTAPDHHQASKGGETQTTEKRNHQRGRAEGESG